MELKRNYITPAIIIYETHVESPLLDSSQDDHADIKPQPFIYEEDEENYSWGNLWENK